MYKCFECNHLFEDGEQFIYQEHHPYGNTTAAENFSVCPICKGDYMEVQPCKICGGYPSEEYDEDGELCGGICEECINDGIENNFADYVSAYNCPNGFNESYIGTKYEYINEDKSHFAEWLADNYNK